MPYSQGMDTENGIVMLPELLRPYRTQAIAEALGVSAVQAGSYKNGRAFPGASRYETLASFLKIDVATVVHLASAYRNSRQITAA